jgi:large conductance mechanosensitive channel
VIFQMVKIVNKLRVTDAPPTPPVAEDILLLREIRNSLRK